MAIVYRNVGILEEPNYPHKTNQTSSILFESSGSKEMRDQGFRYYIPTADVAGTVNSRSMCPHFTTVRQTKKYIDIVSGSFGFAAVNYGASE